MGVQSSTVEAVVARLAGKSHGVVTRAQLLRAGITRKEIERRIRAGALLREHPGVYRVGHRAPSVHARYMAAVLACGDGAVLCGPAAAHLLGLVKGGVPAPEVTARTHRRVKGVRTRQRRVVDATVWYGIPVTNVPQTLVDLAQGLPNDDLARLCHEAGVRHHTTPDQVHAVLARRPNTPGAAKLRAVMDGEVPVTLSRLEAGFIDMLRENGLELPPQTNRPVGAHYVDCRWPARRLTVELDSYRYHHSRHAWEQDRRRERAARARGDDLRRYTWGDVFERREATLTELRPLLSTVRKGP
jgi:very-short-patch-repair endonuclease